MFEVYEPSKDELDTLFAKKESHYLDFKAVEIAGKSLQKHLVGFANADGGELYIGVDDTDHGFIPRGFRDIEQANQLIQASILDIVPAIESMVVDFLKVTDNNYIVQFIIPKSPKIHHTPGGDCYVRLSAQTQRIKADAVLQLAYSKGFYRFEEKEVDACALRDIIDAGHLTYYLKRIGSRQDPARFLRRNRLLALHVDKTDLVNVGCVLLFDNDPDEVLATKASVKVLRMKTTSDQYKREQLAYHERHSGPLESLVKQVEDRIFTIMKEAEFKVDGVTFNVNYPIEAVHEVLVNAFLHRDYSIADEIQVTIFDNRIQVKSPGRLPGSVTIDNILDAHFARNPNVVRLINKLPKPLNHDLGEGLDTAFRAMNSAGLVPPVIAETDDSVIVTLLHKKIASYEEVIMNHLTDNEFVTNKIVRGLTGEESENKVKSALQRLRRKGLIEPEDPEASKFKFRYRKKTTEEEEEEE